MYSLHSDPRDGRVIQQRVPTVLYFCEGKFARELDAPEHLVEVAGLLHPLDQRQVIRRLPLHAVLRRLQQGQLAFAGLLGRQARGRRLWSLQPLLRLLCCTGGLGTAI